MSKPNVYTVNIDTLRSVPGIGEATIRRIQEMRESGRIITAQNVKNASAADALDFKKPARQVDEQQPRPEEGGATAAPVGGEDASSKDEVASLIRSMSDGINDRFARLDDQVAKIADAVSRIDDRVTRLENREAVTSPLKNQTVYIDETSEPSGDSYRAPPDQYAQDLSVISKWQNRPRPGDQPSSYTGNMQQGLNA